MYEINEPSFSNSCFENFNAEVRRWHTNAKIFATGILILSLLGLLYGTAGIISMNYGLLHPETKMYRYGIILLCIGCIFLGSMFISGCICVGIQIERWCYRQSNGYEDIDNHENPSSTWFLDRDDEFFMSEEEAVMIDVDL